MSGSSASAVVVAGCESSCSLSLDHLHPHPPPPSHEQLCYVHCHLCDTVLAVSVPSSSLLKIVTVRCGHCSNLLPVNMRALLLPLPPPPVAPSFTNSLFCPPNPYYHPQRGTPNPAPNFVLTQPNGATNCLAMSSSSSTSSTRGGSYNHLPRSPNINRPPEKRQRVPSAYNRFIKEEIQRIKAGNPHISHREAFSAAAKNWAHFPHIQFGLMSDQTVKRTTNIRPHSPLSQDSGGDVRMKDGFFATSSNVGLSPY